MIDGLSSRGSGILPDGSKIRWLSDRQDACLAFPQITADRALNPDQLFDRQARLIVV